MPVTKAIILAGGMDPGLLPGSDPLPKALLPVADIPLLHYVVANLRDHGVREVFIACNAQDERLFRESCAPWMKGIRISVIAESFPLGTAGALQPIGSRIAGEPFWVLEGGLFTALDFGKIEKFHTREKAATTIVARRIELPTEGISMNPKGEVEKLHLFHKSRDRRKTYIPSGIYLFNPETLKCLDDRGYFDLKEQFIPRLRESGLPVRIFDLNGEGIVRSIRSLKDYYEVNWEVVREDRMSGLNGGRRPGGNRVWIGKGAVVSDSARLMGPVVIGEGAAVGANCQIIGPAVVGSGARLEEGVLFRESVALPGAVVPKGSQVEYAFWTSRGEVPCSGGQGGRLGWGSDPALDGEESLPSAAGEKGSYVFFKRAADVSLAALGLILLSPLFILIVLAIRLDSPGPVFYTKRRCGLGGREFPMVKFRTMISGADRLQQELFNQNEVDGPVFKIWKDPRITRVGGFLRRTSLDELPQLWNVFCGEMSLVGPRPLVMEEMRFNPKWRDIRLTVRPGITGLWQINGRGEESFHDWIQHDIAYVLKRSFALDLKILFETVHKTVRRIGAH